MNTDIEKLEWALFGAYLLDCGGIRERVKSSNITNEKIAACIQEMEQHAKGEINGADIRHVPSLMESLGCRTDVKAIQAIQMRVREHREDARMNLLMAKGYSTTDREEKLRCIDQLIQLRGEQNNGEF